MSPTKSKNSGNLKGNKFNIDDIIETNNDESGKRLKTIGQIVSPSHTNETFTQNSPVPNSKYMSKKYIGQQSFTQMNEQQPFKIEKKTMSD